MGHHQDQGQTDTFRKVSTETQLCFDPLRLCQNSNIFGIQNTLSWWHSLTGFQIICCLETKLSNSIHNKCQWETGILCDSLPETMKRKRFGSQKGRDLTFQSVKLARADEEHKPRMDKQAYYPDENLTCTICYAIFTDPVTIKCSHSFCKECLQEYWRDLDVCLCPICRAECSSEEPTLSLAFKTLCESVRSQNRTGQLCPVHGEKLKLFCIEDKQPICVICYTSKRHKNHACSPIEEVVFDLKVQPLPPCHSIF